VNPLADPGNKAVVLLFIRTDCPISNRYAPEIERLFARYQTNDIKFWLIYPDADTTPEQITTHTKDYALSLPALRDPQHQLVLNAGVHVTPEVAVFKNGAGLVYRGRIDNRYADFGKERPQASQHDLQEVLDALVQGKPVPQRSTAAIGCYISDLPQ
jgi:hypothetical protein